MTDRSAALWARVAIIGVGLLFAFGIFADAMARQAEGLPINRSDIVFALIILVFPIVGFLILARQPRNRIGWILMSIGLLWASPFSGYGHLALATGLPGGAVALAISSPLWAPPIGVMGTFLLLRFPNGKLLSPRWKKVEWLAAFAISASVMAIMFAPGKIEDSVYPNLDNPLGISALKQFDVLLLSVIFLIPVSTVASAASLVIRFRRSKGTERIQLKWLASAGAVVACLYFAVTLATIQGSWEGLPSNPTWLAVFQIIAVGSFLLIPLSIGFAVLKYRLYDINVVINKALVYGALVVFITALYLSVVIGIGSLVGGEASLPLSIAATALIAVGFQPLRSRAQAIANRLVYGQRVSPYEAMAEFSHQMAGVLEVEEVLPRMAETAAKGVRASSARVRVLLPDGTDRASFWPADTTTELFDKTISVTFGGETVGEISVSKERGEAISDAEQKLLDDLASQAGLALRNVRLTFELQQKLHQISGQAEDLRASRQRIVTAQDDERRRMERDIHDGAQQQLVAMSVKLGLVESLLKRDPEKAAPLLTDLRGEAAEAVETLRDLARGLFPQVLADRGLADAITAHIEKMSIRGGVSNNSIPRLPQDVETAVYFVIREALQNASKHAGRSEINVDLSYENGQLTFEVRDHGPGFDPTSNGRGSGMQNMRDRIEALGGTFEVKSQAGEGATVIGKVPAQ